MFCDWLDAQFPQTTLDSSGPFFEVSFSLTLASKHFFGKGGPLRTNSLENNVMLSFQVALKSVPVRFSMINLDLEADNL